MNQQLRRFLQIACITALTVTMISTSFAKGSTSSTGASGASARVTTDQATALLQRGGLEFVENKGQVVDTKGDRRSEIKFTANSKSTNVYFLPDRIMYAYTMVEGVQPNKGEPMTREMLKSLKFSQYRMDMELVGANSKTSIVPGLQNPGVENFYTAGLGAEGVTGVRTFGKLTYENVYPNIDMVLVSKGKGLKAEFIVRPGGNPNDIVMHFAGADAVQKMNDGGYKVSSSMGSMTEDAPYSFVKSTNGNVEVPVTFVVNSDDKTVRFNVPNYDKSQTLVIDPNRDWGSFVGGANEDVVNGVATARSFNPSATTTYIYAVGYTATFAAPWSLGFGTGGGSYDAFIVGYQYGSSGTNRAFATRFGGSLDDRATGVAVDASGVAYVCGQTGGDGSFTTAGVSQGAFGGDIADGFVASFTSAGARSAATYLGGTLDDYLTGIALDNSSNLTVSGYTASSGLGTAGTFQSSIGTATYSGLVARLNTSLTTRSWVTYYGNASETYAMGVAATNTAGEVWIGGFTRCTNSAQAIATTGSHSAALNNNGTGTTTGATKFDGFVARMTSSGGRTASSYIGGIDDDRVMGVANDANNNAVVAVGYSNSPSTGPQHIASAAGVPQSQVNGTNAALGPNDGFINRMSVSGTTLVRTWGTFWGSANEDKLFSAFVDDNNVTGPLETNKGGKYYVAGQSNAAVGGFYGGGAEFTLGTNNTNQGGSDGVFTRVRADGTTFEFAATIGSNLDDGAYGITADNQRNIIVGGYAQGSGANNIGTGSAQNANAGGTDGFVFKFGNLIIPNAPTYSTAGEGGTFSASTNVCSGLNSTSTGYSGLASGTSTGSCPASGVQTMVVRLDNAVQGVTYSLKNSSIGGNPVVNITAGTGTTQSGATAVVATTDGTIYVSLSSATLANAAMFNSSGAGSANNLFWNATTPSAVTEDGAVNNLIVATPPANDAISQSAPGTDNNGAAAAGSSFNFFACANGSTTNTYSVANAPAAVSYQWCVLQNGTTTTPPTITGGTISQTINVTYPNTTTRDTFFIRVRETSVANGACSIEYKAAVFVQPVLEIVAATANEATVATANAANICGPGASSGTYQESTPHGLPYGAPPNIGVGGFGNDAITANTTGYAWSATNPAGVTGIAFASASAANGGAVTVTGTPTANPGTSTFTLQESYTVGGLNGCNRSANYSVNIYPVPTATVVGSTQGTSVCEGSANTTYTITVSPASITSGTFSVTLNQAAGLSGATIASVGNANGGSTGGTTYSGNFTANTFTIVVTQGTVSTAYDNQGTHTLTLNTLTNGAATTAGITCGLSPAVTSGTTTVTQLPDALTSMTSQNANTGTPSGVTPISTTLLPNTALQTDNAAPFTMDACLGSSTYGQRYTYAVAAPTGGANGNDYYDWTVPAGGAITAGGDGIGSTTVTVNWSATGSQAITVQQQNNQAPATGVGPFGSSCNTTTTFTTTVRSAPTATLQWNGTASTADDQVCEGNSITLNVTGGPANGSVQLYDLNAAATVTGGGTFNIATLGLPIATASLNGSGVGSLTLATTTGTITGTAVFPGSATAVFRVAVVDALSNGAQCSNILTTPTLTVFDEPTSPNITGSEPICPGALGLVPPATNASSNNYSVSNTASFPVGTTYTWTLFSSTNTALTYGTDYTVSGGQASLTNNAGTVTGLQIHPSVTSLVRWRVVVNYPSGSGSCTKTFDWSTSPILAGLQADVTVTAIPTPDISNAAAAATPLNYAVGSPATVPGTPKYCSNTTQTFRVITPVGGNTYVWSTSDTIVGDSYPAGFGLPTNFQVSIPSFSSPAYKLMQIRVVETNPAGCQQADTVTIHWTPVPMDSVIQIAGPGGVPVWPNACQYNNENSHISVFTVPKSAHYQISSVTWTVAGTAPYSVYSYSSSSPNVPAGTLGSAAGAQDTIRIQWLGTGTYSVGATVSLVGSPCAPFVTTAKAGTVYPAASPLISGPASVCKQKASETATYNANPVVSGDTYFWDITPSTGGTFTVSGTAAQSGLGMTSVNINWSGAANNSYTVRCIQVSAQGCTARTSYTVTINPNPVPVVSGPTQVCANQVATYSTNNNSPNNSYSWTLAGAGSPSFVGGVNNTATVQVNTGSAGTFTIKVLETVLATSCNTETANTTVTVSNAPIPTISRTSPVGGSTGAACTGTSYTYTASASGSVTYQWALNGTALVGETNATHTRTWSSTGTNTLSCTVTLTSTQCSTTVNQVVVVSAPPAPSVSGPTAVCGGGDSPLLTYTYTTTLNASNSYLWSFSGGATNITPTSGVGVNSVTVNWAGAATSRTVQVQETDPATNCSNTSAAYTVNVTTRPNPTMPTISATCQNTTSSYVFTGLLSSSTRTYSITGGSHSVTANNATDATIAVTWSTAGTGSIQITETNGACSYSKSVSGTVNPAPTAFTVSTSTSSLCATSTLPNAIINLSGSQSGVNYQLFRGASSVGSAVPGTGSALQFTDNTYGGVGTYNYTVVGTNASTTCSQTMTGSATVTVNALPTPSVSGNSPVCVGSTQNYSTASAASRSWAWSVPNGTINSGQGSNTINVTWGTTTGATTVSVVETNTSTGCNASSSLPVTVNANPSVLTVAPTAASVCFGGGTSVNVTLSGGNGQSGVTYELLNGASVLASVAGTGSSAVSFTVNTGTGTQQLNVGSHTLTVRATAAAPCNTPVTMNGSCAVTVNARPNPTISGPLTVCSNTSQTYSVANNSGSSYAWSVSGSGVSITGTSNTASVTVAYAASATSGTVSVTETNAAGCTQNPAPTSVVVTVNTTPNVLTVSPTAASVCFGGGTSVGISLSGGNGQNGITYELLSGTSVLSTVTGTGTTPVSFTVATGTGTQQLNVGSYNLTVRATGTGSCTSTMNGSCAVTVNSRPSPTISGPLTVCSSTSQTYSVASNSGSTYAWTVTGTGVSITGTNNTSSITVAYSASATTGTVNVTETNAAGCTQSPAPTSVSVTVNTTPTPSITGNATPCQNVSTTYTTSTVAGATYAWTVSSGGQITSGQGSTSATVNWNTAGNQTVTVTVTSAASCVGSVTNNITVSAQPTAFAVSTSTPSLCATTTPQTAIINVAGSQSGVTYQLFRGSTALTPTTPGTGSAIQLSDAAYGGVGTYNYTVVATSGAGCTQTMSGTATVTVNALPNATISGNATTCSGVSQTYSVTAAGSQSYNWTVPSGWTIVSGGTTNAMTATTGTTGGNVSVVVTNTSTNCNNSGLFAVTVTPAPTVFNVTPTTAAICIGQTSTINLSGSQAGVTYNVLKNAQTIATTTGTGSALALTIPASAVNSVGTHTFTMTAVAAAPCNSTVINMAGSLTVTVNPLPVPSISGSTTACIGQATTYTTGATTNNFSWSLSSGTGTFNGPTNTNSASVTFTGTAGARTVQVIETNPNTGCVQSAIINVTANATPAPSVQPGPTASACASSTQTYSTTNNAGNTYSWAVTGAGGQVTAGQGTSSVSVQWGSSAGTGTVTVTETAGSCSNTSSTTVTVNAVPVAYSVGTTTNTVCVTGNALITLSNSQVGFTYTLSRNGVAQTPTVSGTGGQIQFSNSISAAGVYGYTISATGSGCSNLMNGTATVTAVNPPTPTLSGTTTICSNSSASYAVTPQTAGSTYQFSVSGTGNTLGSQSGNQQVVNWGTNSGTLSVIETNNTCTGSTSLAVTVLAAPNTYNVSLSPSTICATGGLGTNTTASTVSLSGSQNGFTYELVNAQGNVVRSATGTGGSISFSPALSDLTVGSYVYTVRAISNTIPACSTSAMSNNVTLTVVANPAPAITGTTTPCQNATVTYQTTNNTGSTYSWSIVSGTGSFAPLNTYQVTGSWSSIGAATIRVVETNANGCSQANNLAVTVTSAPTPTIAASPSTSPVCGQSSVTYSTTASGQTYAWTVGNGGTLVSGNNTNSIVVSWANATPDVAYASTVGLTVSNGGCTGSTSTNVTVNPKANPTVSGDAARCSGQSGSYSTPFVVSGRSYSWTITNLPPGMTFTPVSGVNVNAITVNWVNTGAAPVVATVQVVETPGNAGNTCTGTSTFNVTVNPLPSVTISGPAQACQNSSVSYTVTPAQNGLSYAWNVTGANSFTGQGTGTINVAWGTSNGTIALTATNTATGCTNTASNNNYAVTVTANPTPSIATPPGTTACAGSTVTYNVLNPSVSFTYAWSNTGATSASTPAGNSYTVTWPTTPGTGTVTLTATTTGGVACSGSTTRTVSITPNPTPTISGLTSVCPNTDVTYTTAYNAGNTYAWSLPAGTFSVTAGSLTSNTVTVRWSTPGATAQVRSVTITETSQTACVGSAQVNVTVNPAPAPTVSGNTNVCGYMANYDGLSINNIETYTVTNPVNTQSTFVWSLPNQGGTFVTASQGVGVTSVTVQWNEPTTSASITRVLRVQETTNAAPSCTGQTDVNVQVNWNPKPAITGNRTVCSNSQYAANNTNAQMYTPYTYVTPGLNQTINPPASSYTWDVRDANNVSILTSNPATTVPGARITGTGNQVQVEYFNPTNAPVTMVLRVTESIAYSNASLTPSVKSCPITDSFVVVVNPLPKPIIAPAPTDVCSRSTATYATTGDANSSFGWVASSGSIVGASNANSVTITWTNATVDNTPGFIQVTQTFNATGCATTVRQNVNVDVTPNPVITGSSVICQGTTNGTNTATYSVASVVANRAYLWSIDSPTSGAVTLTASGANNGSSFTVVANGNTTTPVTGVIRLRETATDATNNGASGAGCFAETTYSITINPNPTPVITSATGGLNVNGVCAGSTHSYATTNNTANTYIWTVVGGSFNGSSTTNSVNVTWGAAGAGSIAVRERVGAAGCYTDVTAPITIRPLPTPDLTNQVGGQNPTQVCAQGTATYATPNVVGNAYAWTVTGGSINGASNTNAINVVWGAAGVGSVSVTETSPASLGSCSASRSLSVTINPLPTPSIQGPPSPAVCINSTQTYTTTLTAGRTYQWSGIVGGSFVGATNTNTVNVNWTAAGNGSLTVTETNTTTGCVGTATRTIPVNALPNVTITPSGPTSLCVGGTVTLAATDGFASYTWSTGETTPRITVRQAGTYSVTVIDGNGCRNTSSTITVSTSNFTKPTVQLNGTASFCEGESRTLTAQTSGGTPLAYRWNTGATTASITVSTSGTFNVEVTYSNSCKILSDDVTITVSPKPTVSVTASGSTKFCEGGNVVLDAGAGFASYSWKNGANTVGTGRTLRVTAAGSYTVTVANAAGCTATSTATAVTVNPVPTVTVTASGSTSFCQGDSVTLDAGAGFQSYAWSPGGATTQRITVRNGGNYFVTVTDTNGCSGQSAPKAVQVFPTPQKPGVTRVGNLMTTDTAGKGYTAFQWKLNNTNISGATSASYDAVRTGLGLYKVVITDRNGCTNESDPIRIDTVLDVTDPSALSQGVSLYPNPTTGSLTVKVSLDQDAQAVTLTVRNIVGATVSSYTLDNLVIGENIKPLDLSTLPSGVYMVEVAMPNGKRISARITKVD